MDGFYWDKTQNDSSRLVIMEYQDITEQKLCATNNL